MATGANSWFMRRIIVFAHVFLNRYLSLSTSNADIRFQLLLL